ncbi:MAG: TetR/AcrR family transcriptional regulator [Allosphingosinicella sp.]|uniref:TetR/AcrR family transcriptional regulator n=1 Tax=Allosphingosinicella sp. TaxID=2823234 RepID=UPI003944D38C
MARPRTIDEARVLRAAREVFVARGAEATTREVAEAAGISQAVLFQRYGTKKRLFFAAMLPKPPALDELIGDMPPAGVKSARTYLLGLVERLLAWIEPAMPGALRAALHPDFPAAVAEVHAPGGPDAVRAAIADRLSLLQDRGDLARCIEAGRLAAVLLELVHGQALTALLAGTAETRADRAERAGSLLWSGLDPKEKRA